MIVEQNVKKLWLFFIGLMPIVDLYGKIYKFLCMNLATLYSILLLHWT
ncbi:hypothetical protein GCHA_1846 [Paraglaciecola chathamensis S18K6]|uniref:Uncharacterized protein n=1 Tax=Paraglaciecola chathamensis S18K6 TaxID=1127672 RepID=A0AAV3UXE5_9ALTE|nr:hypothetical protein GCHA_1846 [Paraglaciecola chathamensis S18K6]